MTGWRHRIFPAALSALLLAGLPGCWSVSAGRPQASPWSRHSLTGSILTPDRQVAALVADIANGATVSLIDSVTGTTLVTGVSSPQGAFSLTPPGAFSPVTGRPYYLEAIKGLAAGGSAHRAGASVARLRTILFPQNGEWTSLTSSTPGDRIQISWATTTVAVVASLRGLSPGDQLGLIGKVSGQDFAASGTTLGAADFQAVFGLVDQSLKADQDPLEVVGFNSGTGRFGLKPADLAIFQEISPTKTTPGGTVTLNGQNLPLPSAEVAVTVGGLPVAGWSTTADRAQMVLTLPSNAFSGNVEITRGASTWTGPFVPVAGTVGTLVGGLQGTADGRGRFAAFSLITTAYRTAQGEVLIADYGNNHIRRLDAAGNVTTLRDGSGAPISNVGGVVSDSQGNVFATCQSDHTIKKITPSGLMTTLAGSGTPGYQDGTGAGAIFSYPHSLAIDAAGNLYVTDYNNHRIRMVTPAGVVTTLAGGATAGSTDGTGTNALFSSPNAICYDGVDTLYISEAGNHRIRKLTISSRAVTTLAGSTQGYADGNGATAQFDYPHAVAVDPSGNVYVGEYNGERIRKITPAGVVSTLAGTGTAGYIDGPLATARFYGPSGLSLDPAGNLYVADRHNHRVRVIVP